MPRVTFEQLIHEVQGHDPDVILPPDPEFADEYARRVAAGREAAKQRSVAFVAICRNAMPFLQFTLQRVEQTGLMFKHWKAFIFENDSADGTKELLAAASAACDRLTVISEDNGRPHLNFTKTSDRTIPLAEYRNRCRQWVSEACPDADYVIVFDSDSWGGWSIDGVANTIGHLEDPQYADAAGMGAYSWAIWGPPVWPQPTECHYDAWACRWSWWNERHNMLWFHLWHPPVGSRPIEMNSCFGQLGVYRTRNYLQGVYQGGDCEHVAHWRTCGGRCYLNPSQRVVSFWIPSDEYKKGESDRLHDGIHSDVDRRDSNPDHR